MMIYDTTIAPNSRKRATGGYPINRVHKVYPTLNHDLGILYIRVDPALMLPPLSIPISSKGAFQK